MADDRGESYHLEAMTSKIDFKMNLLNDVMADYREIKQVISGVMKEKESLQQEKEMVQQEHLENEKILARMKEETLSYKKKLAEASDSLASSAEWVSQKDKYVQFLEKKLQESEAKNNQAEQQGGTKPIGPGEVQTRSLQKRKRPSEGPLDYDSDANEPTSQLDDRPLSPLESLENPNTTSMKMKRRLSERTLGNDADNLEAIKEGPRQEVANNGQTSGVQLHDEDDLEAINKELIKGFRNINCSRRKIGIKKMGELSEKAFKTACHAKIPPEEVDAAFDQLHSSWKQRLRDLSWYPFKSVTIDGNCQEIVNLDDDKLQELKGVWGQDAHNAVVTALLEMKEYDCLSDRRTADELWNYNEGRKATTKECVEYLFNQVKLLLGNKRRNTLRSSGRA